MRQESAAIDKFKTYDSVDLPPDRKLVGTKWVYKIKPLLDNTVKYKARLVAQGFTQQEGIDYEETFASVVKFKSLRTLFSLACQRKMHIHQLDVSNAFLNGHIDKEVFCKPPPGTIPPPGCENKVWKLNRTLYGLKQSPRAWNEKLNSAILFEGFTRTHSDYGVYSKGTG